jgi:hypothetical protein
MKNRNWPSIRETQLRSGWDVGELMVISSKYLVSDLTPIKGILKSIEQAHSHLRAVSFSGAGW